jgi:hypothetical protein
MTALKSTPMRAAVYVAPLIVGLFGGAGIAVAQEPTPDQQSAIRSNCRSDFMVATPTASPAAAKPAAPVALTPPAAAAKPASVKPAAPPARAAPAAKSAAKPPASAPVPAAAPPAVIVVAPRQVFVLVRTKCRAEYRAYCSDVDIGGGRVVACLQSNAASLSPTCQSGLAELGR